MERKTKPSVTPIVNVSKGAEESQLVTYRKIGGGSFNLKNRIIKPNETFTALPSDIPKAFLNALIVVTPAEKQEEPNVNFQKPEGFKEVFSLKKDEENSTQKNPMFHIVSNTGKQITEESLEKEEAEQMLKACN